MRVYGDGYDANPRVAGGCGRGPVAGRGVLGRRRGHREEAAHRGPLGPRDHGRGGVPPLARLLGGLLRARAGAARDARER